MMTLNQGFSEQNLIQYLKQYYDIEAISLTPLLLGADLNASVYKVKDSNQQKYFVKLKTGHSHDVAVILLDLLHQHDIEEIIPPIKTVQGLSSQAVDGYTLIVFPFIDNKNGFVQPLSKDQWITLGEVLRKVHEFQIPPSIQDLIRKEDFSPKSRTHVRSLYAHIDIHPIEDPWAKKMSVLMKTYQNEIDRLLNTAEKLGQKLQIESDKFVLCHADIHGGNVLIGENGTIYIVDWDQPIMAPKERDLMFIGGGVANVWNDPYEEELFYKGYGSTEINTPILAYYRHQRIIEDIAEYAQEFLFNINQEDKSEMYQQFIAMFEPRGVVDIAFKTHFELSDL